MPRPHTIRLTLLVISLTLVAAASWWLQRSQQMPIVAPDEVMPPGYWIRTAPLPTSPPTASTEKDNEAEELAQILSLPYSAGSAPAPEQRGVVHHDRQHAQPGVNLYVSGHGPEVILIDMDGGFLHRWRRSFEEIFPQHPPGPETDFIRRARLLPDGSLLVLFQGGGLARLDALSNVLWAAPGAFFNDFDVARDRIYVLGKTARILPSVRAEEAVLEDFVAVLDLASGERLEQAPLLPAFHLGGLAGVLEPLPDTPDIFHSNTVTILDDPASSPLQTPDGKAIFAPGHLLLSLREVNVVAVLDLTLQQILWAQRGPWVAQHEPVLLEGGQLLVFDNRGGPEKRSRVLTWDLAAETLSWSFEHPSFHSRQAGVAARLANGNTLITSSEQGRVFEIDTQGRVVWEMVSSHRAGKQNEWVANLFEVQRLPLEAVTWIGE